MIILRIFLIIFCILTYSLAVAQPINEEVTRYIDLTGDGKPEKITSTFKGTDISKQLQWTLTISSDKKVLLQHTDNNSLYYKDIFTILIVPRSRYSIEGIFDKNSENTLYPVGRAYLAKCCGIGLKQANQILANIEKRIRGGSAVIIKIPETPELLTFCNEVNRFIPVYEE